MNNVSQPKVFEFAKEIGMETLALMDKIREWKLPVRSHMAELDQEVLEQIRTRLRGDNGTGTDSTKKKKVVKKAAGAAATGGSAAGASQGASPTAGKKVAAKKICCSKRQHGNGARRDDEEGERGS